MEIDQSKITQVTPPSRVYVEHPEKNEADIQMRLISIEL
jgi:hypothetical protein